MNYRNTPFLRVLLPFAAGIILGDSLPYYPQVSTALLTITGISVLSAGWKYSFPYRWVFGLIIQINLLLLGFWYTGKHNELNNPNHFSTCLPADQPVIIQGIVNDMPVQEGNQKVQIAVQSIQTQDSSTRKCSGNLMVFVRADSLPTPAKYGDKVSIPARITPVSPPANPDAFDYRNYLHHQNIHYNAYVKSSQITILKSNQGNIIWAKAFACRNQLLEVLQRYFKGQDEYAVASALLVGYKEDLSDEIKIAYAETGSMHALAVSGTHVGLLYIGLLFLLQRLPLHGRKGRLIETLLALAAIWAFTFLTGATASVLRASVMFSTHLVGKMVFRQANIWNVLSASAFGLLLYNPYFLFDAGFQLSYAAVVGMAFFYPLMFKASPVMKYKWMDEAWKVLLVGFAAQIGTLPLSLFYFHQFPCYFWLAGWVVVLGGAIFLWAGTLLIVLDVALPMAAGWLGYLLNGMLWLMNQIISGIQHLPGSVVSGIWITGLGASILYLVIAALGVTIVLKKTKALLAALTGFACLLMAGAFRNMDQTRQKEICIYSISKATMIDFFDGHQRTTFSENTTAKQENFAAQSHRWASGIEHRTGDGLGFDKDSVLNDIIIKNNIIFFKNKTLAITDGQPATNPTPVNFLLVTNNPEMSLQNLLKSYPAARVIVDLSNTWKTAQRIKLEAKELGVAVWDVREKGAWLTKW